MSDIDLIPIDNDKGYDQGVVAGILNHHVCGVCGRALIKVHHPKSFTWAIKCRFPECSGGSYVHKKTLDRVLEYRALQAREVMANFPEYFQEENQSSPDDDTSWLTQKIGDK